MDPLAPQIDASDLERIPEPLRGYYAPVEGSEGKLRLQVARQGGLALEDVSGLERTLAERKEKHQKASTRLQSIESALGDDVTLDDIGTVLKEWRELKSKPAGSGGKGGLSDEEVQRRVADALGGKEKAWTEERSAILAERDEVSIELDTFMRTLAAQNAITKNKGNAELLLPHVLKHVKVIKGDDGKRRAVVVDEEGRPREVVKDGKLRPVDPVDFVAEHFKKSEAFGSAFNGTDASGSGSGPTNKPRGGPATGSNPFRAKTFNLTKISQLTKADRAEAKRLKAEAEQTGDLDPRCANMLRD